MLWATALARLVGPVPTHSARATVETVAFAALWWFALTLFAGRDRRVLGLGHEEYQRVLVASANFAGLTATLAYLGHADQWRPHLLVAIPVGTFSLLLSRWLWRQRLHAGRRRGVLMSRTLVVGNGKRADELLSQLRGVPWAGYQVVGVWPVSERGGTDAADDTQWSRRLVRMARQWDISVIAVTSTDILGPETMRRLGWELEGTDIDLVVMPGLASVSGPRIQTRPVAGVPLLYIEKPTFSGPGMAGKRILDIALSMTGCLVLAPLLIAIAVAIKLDSSGPVIYRQRRIGQHGREFTIWKFRTMVADADRLRHELIDANESDGPLFKIRNDPRVTTVGRFLRKHSLDELPQLCNVVIGRMSLVGPRPPLPEEVHGYAKDTRRRLLVAPGMTGPWQIMGRSDLSWRDGVELDLYYVENWSLMGDLAILWKTLRVVVRGAGAY